MIWLALLAWLLGLALIAFISQRWLWALNIGRGWLAGLTRLLLGSVFVLFAAILFATALIPVIDSGAVRLADLVTAILLYWPGVASVAAWSVFAPVRVIYLPLLFGAALPVFMTSQICGVGFAWHLYEEGQCTATDQPIEVFLSLLIIGLVPSTIGVVTGYALKRGLIASRLMSGLAP